MELAAIVSGVVARHASGVRRTLAWHRGHVAPGRGSESAFRACAWRDDAPRRSALHRLVRLRARVAAGGAILARPGDAAVVTRPLRQAPASDRKDDGLSRHGGL